MIDRYFYYSYNPDCPQKGLVESIRDVVQKETEAENRKELINAGKQALKKSVDKELEVTDTDAQHIVPLSSGLDSRIILALLLDHPDVDPHSITTVSFGTPGTWDFEIGQEIANTANVRNIAINLTHDEFDWSLSSLRAYVRNRECPVRIFEGYVNSKILDPIGSDAVVWSGFMGDPTAGGHQPDDPSNNWNTACEHFVEANRFVEGLCSPDFNPTDMLPDEPYLKKTHLSYEEQLDFAHRQQCLIAPLVLPEPERYCTPFMQPRWLSFSLNLPREHRRNRSLFKDIVTEMYPDLFSLPTDANRGLPLNAGRVREFLHRSRLFATRNVMRTIGVEYLPPSANYLDFENAFRTTGQLHTSAENIVEDFAERESINWIEPREIWRDHQLGQDRTDQIRAICLVELILSETDMIPHLD